MDRRAFLGWTGLTSYGAWVLLKPPPQAQSRRPPKPTTTTTTMLPPGGADTYADPYGDIA